MKINFVYSRVYDELLHRYIKKELSELFIKEMLLFNEEFEAFWEKDGKKIISNIEKISRLKFKGNKNCYLVSNMFYAAISEPLTLRKENLIDMKMRLIHELVHILISDNYNKLNDLINRIYPEESVEFRTHIPVLLITRKVVENIFGERSFKELLDKDMKIELRYIWPEVNSIYPKFKGDIVRFLKNEKFY